MMGNCPVVGLSPAAAAQEISPAMLDESACRRWVLLATRGEVLQCPSCGAAFDDVQRVRLLDDKRVNCHCCGVASTHRSGTILEGSTLSDAQVVFMLALLHWDLPVPQIASMTGCTRATVYNWRNKLGGAL